MPTQIHGNTRLEVGWTIVPAVVLAVVMVPTVGMIWDLARPPAPDALNVTVKGYQWWWGFEYTDQDMTGYGDKPVAGRPTSGGAHRSAGLPAPVGRRAAIANDANDAIPTTR